MEEDVSPYLTAELTAFDEETNTFTLVITNLVGESLETAPIEEPIRISPGAIATHSASENDPFFTVGEPQRGNGLQLLAERGDFSELETFFAQ